MFKLKLSEFLDKVVLLCTMCVFAWVGMMAIREARYLDSIAGQDRPLLSEMMLNAPRYEALAPENIEMAWQSPQSQSRGKDWVFDVFTPPVIYYDPISEAFAVTPPNSPGNSQDAGAWAMFDVELLEVRPRPYRLQLVGYAGEPGNYLAYLERISTGELLVAREGKELKEADIRLVGFEEKRVELTAEDSMPVYQNIGIAKVYDGQTDQVISLTNVETKMFTDLEARLRVRSTGKVHQVKTGSRIDLSSGEYVIGDLSISPEAATVVKFSKDGSRSISKILNPATSSSPERNGGRENAPSQSPFSIRPKRPATQL